MTMSTTEFYRLDPLTGSNNFLSFVEALGRLISRDEKKQFSILDADLNNLTRLIAEKGSSYGDSAIRWTEIVLREECKALTYRIGFDEFMVIITTGSHVDHEELSERISVRLKKEGESIGMQSPAATISLVHYDEGTDISLINIMFHLAKAMIDAKIKKDKIVNVYFARELEETETQAQEPIHWNGPSSKDIFKGIANETIELVVSMGSILDEAQKASYVDSISGLPNMRAALLQVDKVLSEAVASNQPFSVLLIDGDNLRLFNNISYAVGDEMIKNMSAVLLDKLRPGDFVARWRTGDEFIVILPNTESAGAKIVGERFCATIRETSQTWIFPTSISIGISTYPQHGNNLNALVDVAERAMKHAKDEGKDRVVLAE